VLIRAPWFAAGLSMILATSLMSCSEPLPTPRQVASQTDLDDVRAAVLLRLYAQAIRLVPEARVMCVGVERGEPSTHLLMSLSGRNIPVRKPSRCAVRGIGLVDPISDADAVQVFVTDVNLIAPGEALAEGGYAHGPLAGQGMAYKLEFRLGQWEVVEERATWVS